MQARDMKMPREAPLREYDDGLAWGSDETSVVAGGAADGATGANGGAMPGWETGLLIALTFSAAAWAVLGWGLL